MHMQLVVMLRRLGFFAARVDRFCARLNGGLAAVVIVLAVLTAALATSRGLEALNSFDPPSAPSSASF